jgi:hypothetical protein
MGAEVNNTIMAAWVPGRSRPDSFAAMRHRNDEETAYKMERGTLVRTFLWENDGISKMDGSANQANLANLYFVR